MGKYRKIDATPGRTNRQIAALKRAVAQERSATRLASSEVAEGGSSIWRGILSVIGLLDLTGTMSMKSDLGDEIIRMGDMPQGDRGLEFKREDGTLAYQLRKPFAPTDSQAWSLHDRVGNIVVAENSVGPGLLRPYLELPFKPCKAPSAWGIDGPGVAMSSGSWETLFAYDGRAQNLFIDFKFAAICSDGTTAGQIQVVDLDTGVARPGYLSTSWVGAIPTGTTTLTYVDPTPDKVISTVDTVGAGGYMRLGVQVRRTAGAGTITLSVAQAIGG